MQPVKIHGWVILELFILKWLAYNFYGSQTIVVYTMCTSRVFKSIVWNEKAGL